MKRWQGVTTASSVPFKLRARSRVHWPVATFGLQFAVLLALVATSSADTISFTGSGPASQNGADGTLEAKAVFSVSGSHLVITLSNIATSNDIVTVQQADVLTGVLFDVHNSSLTGSGGSVTLSTGSSVWVVGNTSAGTGGNITSLIPGGDLSPEWAYAANPHWSGSNYSFGVEAAGLFAAKTFAIGHLPYEKKDNHPTTPPDGSAYGIIPTANAEGPLYSDGTSGLAYVQNSVTITLPGFGGNSLKDISNVFFQYGTGAGEPGFGGGSTTGIVPPPPVPEPTGLAALLGLASMGFVGLIWRRRKQAT
jgi:hypothetical protein